MSPPLQASHSLGPIDRGAPRRLDGVEAGRGIAALLVVMFHAHDHLTLAHPGVASIDRLFSFGHVGVVFFFVLSGFIIAWVHAPDVGRPGRLEHYARRRFTRIYPFYWAALAATLVLVLVSPHAGTPSVARLVGSVLLTPDGSPIVGVSWTLQFEVVFYILFAALIVGRGAGIVVFAAWAGLMAYRALAGEPVFPFEPFILLSSSFNLLFFIGIAAAFVLRRPIPHARALLAAGIITFAGLGAWEDVRFVGWIADPAHAGLNPGAAAGDLPLPLRLGYAAASAAVLTGLVGAERSGRLTVPPVFRRLGDASFSLYLTHFLSIGVAWQVLARLELIDRLPVWVEFTVLVSVAVTAAILVNHWVEKPLTGLFRRLLRSRARQPVYAAPLPAADSV